MSAGGLEAAMLKLLRRLQNGPVIGRDLHIHQRGLGEARRRGLVSCSVVDGPRHTNIWQLTTAGVEHLLGELRAAA